MTLVGVGSVTSDGSLDEKESEEFGRLQRQQVNDSSPLLALANGGTNADIVSRTNREYARRSGALQSSSTESFHIVRNHHCPRFLSCQLWNNNHRVTGRHWVWDTGTVQQ